MSLPFFVIRVLSDYHRFDGVIIGVFQRVEYVVHRRIADVMRILVFQKFADFKVVFSRKSSFKISSQLLPMLTIYYLSSSYFLAIMASI